MTSWIITQQWQQQQKYFETRMQSLSLTAPIHRACDGGEDTEAEKKKRQPNEST